MVIDHKTSYFTYTTGSHSISTMSYNYLDYPAAGKPTDNICSDKYSNDRNLAQDIITEMWSSFGVKIIFYKTTYDVNKDRVWGEDTDRYITHGWNVMSYFQLPKENKIWDKFGIGGINDFSIYISKKHFEEETENYIPRVGDLVLTPYNNKLYEITEVKEDAPMFMLSKQYAWEVIVKKAKIENSLSLSPSLSASPISQFYNVEDLFNIKDEIDIEKEDVKYKPEKGEKPNNDPFGQW